jgi:cell division protein FtsZ
MDEVGQITDYIQSAAGEDADLIWGNGTDERLDDKLNVTIIATGFGTNSIPELYARKKKVDVIPLDGEESTNREVKQPLFEIKEKPAAPPKREKPKSDKYQRVIEFDLTQDDKMYNLKPEPRTDEELDFQVSTASPKPADAMPTGKGQVMRSDPTPLPTKDNFDQMEKIPAYKRKNIKIDDATLSKKPNVSRYTLNQEDGDIFLRNDNAYLHDNVD